VSQRLDVQIAHLTHVGMERTVNQDYYGNYIPQDEETLARKGRLIIVCDGMGGHAGGEIASHQAVTTIIERYRQSEETDPRTAIEHAVQEANLAVWEHGQADPELHGMGTTLVALLLHGTTAYFAHVGDSRIYRIRDEALEAMTLDHSLVQQLVNDGVLEEDQMEEHPEKNVILRSMGIKADVEVEINDAEVQAGDIFLLSSDGLTGLVSKQECLQIALLHRDEPEVACARLIELTNRYGGHDNVTVQIVHVRAILEGDDDGDAAAAPANATASCAGTTAGLEGTTVRSVELPRYGLYALTAGVTEDRPGERAAETLVETVKGYAAHIGYLQTLDPLQRQPEALRIFGELFAQGAYRVHMEGEHSNVYRGMGATGIALGVLGGHAVVAHMGDGVCFHVRGESAQQLTLPHTVAGDRARSGLGKPPAAEEGAPDPAQLTRWIGADWACQPDLLWLDVLPEDSLVLLNREAAAALPPGLLPKLIASDAPTAAAVRLREMLLATGASGGAALVVRVLQAEESEQHQAALDRYARIQHLRQLDLLRGLSDLELHQVLAIVHEGQIEPGEVIVGEGAGGENFFLIVEGEAVVE